MDGFDVESEEDQKKMSILGQRYSTVWICLHSAKKGGELIFLALEKAFRVQMGTIFVWKNTLEGSQQRDTSSLHGVSEIIEGELLVMKLWIRALSYTEMM